MARAITAGELALLRSDNQRSNIRLCIVKPSTVFTARVTVVPSGNDEITTVTIGSTTGSAAAVLDGMTVLIGTTAGGYDVGIIRARSATATVLTIGSTSDIEWAVNQYITVLDDFQIWARPLRFSDGLWNIEGEEAYTDQNLNFKPVPILGPTVAVLPYNGAPVDFIPSAAGSWAPGSGISTYAWEAPGASASVDMTTIQPLITYNAPGLYRVRCTMTTPYGVTATGHRLVYVPGTGALPAENFTVEKLTGETSSGGWQFAVTMYDAAELSGIRPRALVVLYADDYYGTTKQSIGPINGYENIVALGWIDGATIDWNPEVGLVRFTVKGPAEWMQKASSWPISLLDATTTPTDWMHINSLYIDRALWHMVSWRSTISKVIDVYPNGDTRRAFDCSGNLGSLWEQLKAFGVKIGAEPICDRYGRLFMETDPQLVPVASRGTIPVVMDITKDDWQGTLNIQKREFRQTSLIEVAGFTWDGSKWGASLARAPGNAMSQTGSMTSRYNFLFADQTNANEIAELLFAKENNSFPTIPIQLAANNRMIDIAPRQYLTLTVGAADTPLGISWNAEKIIPRRVEIALDKESGALLTDIECERATVPISPSVAVIPPSVPTPNLPPLPDFNGYGWPVVPGDYGPPEDYLPPVIGTDPNSTCHISTGAPANGPYNLNVVGTKYDTDEYVYRPFHCYVRSSAHANLTRYEIRGKFQKYNVTLGIWQDTLDDNWYEVRAVAHSGGTITGVKDAIGGNPNIRTGVLPGGLSSQDVHTIQVIFGEQMVINPESVSIWIYHENNNSWTLSEGTYTWWRKRRGIGFEWKNMAIQTGGAVYLPRLSYGVYFQPPAGIVYRNRKYYMHIEVPVKPVEVGAISTGVQSTTTKLVDGRRFPVNVNAYFGEVIPNVPINTNPIGIRWSDYLDTKDWEYECGMTVEIQPYPVYRIIFNGMYLYNICPATE